MIFATKNLYLTSNSPVKSTLFAGSAFKIRDSKNKSDQKTQLSYFQVWCATDKLKFSFQFLIPRYLMFFFNFFNLQRKKTFEKIKRKNLKLYGSNAVIIHLNWRFIKMQDHHQKSSNSLHPSDYRIWWPMGRFWILISVLSFGSQMKYSAATY